MTGFGFDGSAMTAHHVLPQVGLARVLLVAVGILARERHVSRVDVVPLGVDVQRTPRGEFRSAI